MTAETTMSPAVPQDDEAALTRFLTRFIGDLADDGFSQKGNLLAYLKLPEGERSGDEANVVDMKISQLLISSLGYTAKEIDYNQQDKNRRADFVVRIDEYPDRACFVIEDKNTATERLHHHRDQLQSYMASHRAPRGLLNNGKTLIVYDQAAGSIQTPVLEISLTDAVALWHGEHLAALGKTGVAALDAAGIMPSLAAFWRRFRRESFATLTKLIDDLTLQSEAGNNSPHRPNGATWTPRYCRLPLIPVEDDASALTSALRSLIAEIEDDANGQLAVIERDYQVYCDEAERLPRDSFSLAQREEMLAADVIQLMPSASPEDRDAIVELARAVMRGDLSVRELRIVKSRLYVVNSVKAPGKGKDRIAELCDRIEAFTVQRSRHQEALRKRFADTLAVMDWYGQWKAQTAALVFQSDEAGELRREFLTQTAYLIIIRILLVRIMEDKKLVKRMFTNGGLALWFREVEPHYLTHAMGRSANFLLDMAYTSAQHIYAHFYAERTVLDWYQPDRNAVVRVLHVLAGFDLKRINRDIIGTVYNQYVESKHKHESGLYYTPPHVVWYMLERIGYKGTEIIGKRILDLSCGSGGFLVEAAHRLVDAHRQYWRKSGHSHVPADRVQGVLDSIRASLHGVDLNPFACALAETNLLIQVIDLFAIAYDKGEPASIDRFHVYSADSLTFSDETLGHLDGTLPFPVEDLPAADCLKAGIGPWKDKFDYVVGNPPYVRADEGALGLKEFRDRVKQEYPVQSVRDVLTKKWDLFVPFVAASQALLKPRSPYAEPGKAALITSNAIETVPYAESLRRHLVDTVKIEEIHFFEGVKLFEDAAVYNTITVIENDPPSPQHHVTRHWHDEAPKWGSHGRAKSQSLRQGGYGTDVFRQRLPSIEFAPGLTTAALDDVFYISVGMVLNANEKTNKGAFTLDDLMSSVRDGVHCAPYAGSKDVEFFGIGRLQYVEYGPGTRVPGQIRRPTFAELYDRPKLMVAEFGGFAFDDGQWDEGGFLKCNHSVFILMPWHALEEVENKSIRSELGDRLPLRGQLEASSRQYDPWFVLAYLNSRQMRDMLNGVARSAIAGRLQPDDLRQIRIPLPDAELTDALAGLAREAAAVQRELLPLRMAGWRIDDGVIAPAVIPDGIPLIDFASACVKWGLTIQNESAKVKGLTRTQHRLFAGKREVLAAPTATVPEAAVEWLRRQFDHLPGDLTMEQVQRNNVMVPSTPQAAAAALAEIETAEAAVQTKITRIAEIREQISDAMEVLFVRTNHPPIK